MKTRLVLGHWDPPYPLHLFRKSAEERDVYAVLDGDQLIATFTIGTDEPSYYRTIPRLCESWDASGEPALYLNRLAVFPELQGQGIGTWCMQTIEQIALVEGCAADHMQASATACSLLVELRGGTVNPTSQSPPAAEVAMPVMNWARESSSLCQADPSQCSIRPCKTCP